MKDRSETQVRVQQRRNYTQRKLNKERVEEVRRAISEEKFNSHDQVRSMTIRN